MRSSNIDDMTSIEASTYKQLLHARKKFGIEAIKYEEEVLEYTISSDYIPDFTVTFEDGRKMYIECKGWQRPEDKRKMLLVRAQHPDKDIRFVFQRNNRFPRSKTTYGMWADRFNFKWAVGSIPEDWLK